LGGSVHGQSFAKNRVNSTVETPRCGVTVRNGVFQRLMEIVAPLDAAQRAVPALNLNKNWRGVV